MARKLHFMAVLLGFVAGCGGVQEPRQGVMQPEVLYQFTKDFESVCAQFPKTVQEINERTESIIAQTRLAVDAIIAIPAAERTFDNTARALDTVGAHFNTQSSGISILGQVSPDEALREAASQARVKIQQASIDIFRDIKLYNAFKAYYEGQATTEQLTSVERYFIDEEMKAYKQGGFDLPEDQRAQVAQLLKDLGQLSLTFGKNINSDASTISATQDELMGLDDHVLASLKHTEDGNYIVRVDTPTFQAVLEHCSVADTRKRMCQAFFNRAYPANIELLNTIIAKRDQLAQLLGYTSYAHLNIDDEMAQTPEKAEEFLWQLIEKGQKKADQEFERLKQDLPASVELSPDGKMYSWDGGFASAWYKKKHYQVDEREISEYFPMQQTIDRLLKIYETFFDVTMTKEPIDCLWVKDLTLVKVYTKKDTQLLGYLILDLHPRPYKYSHACHMSISRALLTKDGARIPSLSVVLANFPEATDIKPALLPRSAVRTFFHEFGHAMHALLGATHLAAHSGTRVKTDFIEMPSQMLEEWLHDKEILKQVSGHYITGEPLPDSLIDIIIKLKNFGSGGFVLSQTHCALFALGCFGPGGCKDTDELLHNLHDKVIKNRVYDPATHFQASFGHLTGYGARYYGYMWSKVYALDLFEHIKKFGLLNPAIGTVYAEKVIGKGGSAHPMELLKDFLGREPNQEAFLKDLGLCLVF